MAKVKQTIKGCNIGGRNIIQQNISGDNNFQCSGDFTMNCESYTSDGSSVTLSDGKGATINGKYYPFVKGMKGNNISTINNKTYIDGFELINGRWTKTLRAWWHKIW